MKEKWYIFCGAKQSTRDSKGNPYILEGKQRLLKIHRSKLLSIIDFLAGRSWYWIDGHIIDCGGYIEERCLYREEDYCANLPAW